MRLRLLRLLTLTAALATPAAAQNKGEVPTELPAALLAQHAQRSWCDPIEDLVHGNDQQIYRLSGEQYLFMVPCFAGAYNFSYQLYVGRPGDQIFDLLLFANYDDVLGWTGTDELFGAYFDPETLALTSFYKGRGLGDCGASGTWQWEEYAFRLVAFYAKSECDGLGDPGEFPQVWPN
jgi:hypothetical protein